MITAAGLVLSLALSTPNLAPANPSDALAGKPPATTSRLLDFCARGRRLLEHMNARAYADWMREHGAEDFTADARVRLVSREGTRELTAAQYLAETTTELGRVLDYREDWKTFEIKEADEASVCIAQGEQVATVRQGGRWVEVRARVEFRTWIVEGEGGFKVRRLDIFQ